MFDWNKIITNDLYSLQSSYFNPYLPNPVENMSINLFFVYESTLSDFIASDQISILL